MSTDKEAVALRSQCVELLFECPHNSSAPTCPFRKVRAQNDVVKQVNWLKSLSVRELKRLTQRHAKCRCRSKAKRTLTAI